MERTGAKASGSGRTILASLAALGGFDENHIRDEIARTGSTTIPDKVSRLIREGLCACESRNPSGACCLGEVKQTMKRIIGKE